MSEGKDQPLYRNRTPAKVRKEIEHQRMLQGIENATSTFKVMRGAKRVLDDEN